MELAKKIGHSNREYSLPFWTANKLPKNWANGFVAVAHRDGRRFVAHADEKLAAFLELESAISHC
jgi:hypothetical protein